MPERRGLVRGLLGAGLLALLSGMGAGGAAFYYTNAATDAAARFFRTLARQGPATAYGEASAGFRAAMSEPDFAALAARAGLGGYRSVSWSVRSVAFDSVALDATLTLDHGPDLRAALRVDRDAAGAWQVATLSVPRG